MNYKPNFGNNYDYQTQNNLGYSNVSRSYNKFSAKSNTSPIADGPEDHGGYG